MTRSLAVRIERWPLARPFGISRGVKTEAVVVVAEISDGVVSGRGEAVPYARYGETPDSVAEQIQAQAAAIAVGADRGQLRTDMPPGAARNAIDLALWDLQARTERRAVHAMAGMPALVPVETAETIALDEPGAMQAAAAALSDRPLLKVKLGDRDVVASVAAVRSAAPDARIIADANEAWTPAQLINLAPDLADLGVELIEQPVAAADDEALRDVSSPVPLCADESCHTQADLARVTGIYQAVNVKLDKAGGLTEALDLAKAAAQANLDVMVGCMVATSLAMAPALALTSMSRWVDLDGPTWLAKDRDPCLRYEGGLLLPPPPGLWGDGIVA